VHRGRAGIPELEGGYPPNLKRRTANRPRNQCNRRNSCQATVMWLGILILRHSTIRSILTS
jgi:hypothetical protein